MMSGFVRAAVMGMAALAAVQASAQTSISGNVYGAMCTGSHYAVQIYKEDFENNAKARWATGGMCTGCFQIGQPQASWDSTGYKQLGYTPSMQLDPRFWLQGPNAMVTGLTGGSNTDAFDLDGSTNANSLPYQFTIPSNRTVYMDFSYYFAHDATSSSADYFAVDINVPSLRATQPVFIEYGSPVNKNAAWTKKTVNLSAFGLNDRATYVSLFANDGSPAGVVEAAIDDILVYYCQ